MDNNNNGNKGFSFTYSAEEQEELRRIREKYLTENEAEDKMARLRRLDASVSAKAQTVAIIIGVVGILILGFGMSLAMSELSEILGEYRNMAMPVGIIVGLVGGGIAALAYPIYKWILNRERKRIAPEILRLTDELLK